MLGIGGWKTIIGVLFGAFAATLPQAKELIDPNIYRWLMIICSFLGIVLTGLGIGHKIEKAGDKIGNTGSASIITVALLVLISLAGIGFISGCGLNQSATQQIAKQTNDPFLISKAVYLDGRQWYNRSQETFIRHFPTIPKENALEYSALLSDVGAALDAWGLALSINDIDQQNRAEFLEAKNKLIDKGFSLVSE